MGGIFFIPIGIIVSNILYFNQDNYDIILTLSFVIIFFMFIGFIDDFLREIKPEAELAFSTNGTKLSDSTLDLLQNRPNLKINIITATKLLLIVDEGTFSLLSSFHFLLYYLNYLTTCMVRNKS